MVALLEGGQALWEQYGGIITTALVTISTVIGVIVLVWSKIQPILDKLETLKNKVEETKVSDVTTKLQSLTLDTQITDLKAKIANPTVSDELKQQYMNQLQGLLTIQAQIQAGIASVDEVTSKF